MFGNPFYNSVMLAFLCAALAFFAAWFWRSLGIKTATALRLKEEQEERAEKIAEENKLLVASVTELQNQLGLLKQAVLPISTAFQAILIKELTHYHTPEMDGLMSRLGPPTTLTDDEEARLAVLLEERTLDMADDIPESERDAAHMLPFVMKRAKFEQTTLAVAPTEMQIVGVPPKTLEDRAEDAKDDGATDSEKAVSAKKAEEQNKPENG